jgi:phospholipid/cholesterol/gamma-HCH transport system substrate-binding protein
MNERQMQFRVGVVVFATMIVGGLLATLNGPIPMGWLPWGHAKYQIGIEVPQAPGVDTNTPVRKNGILIGRVKSIEDKDGGVLLKADIDGNRPLLTDFEPHIRTTVLGDATIDFLPTRRPAAGAEPVAAGTIFRGHVDPNPFDSLGQLGDLKEEFGAASRSLAQAGDEVSKLANRVNSALGDDNSPDSQGRVKRLLDTTEHAMNQFAQTMQSLNDIIGDEPIGNPSTNPGAAPVNPQPPYRNQTPLNGAQPSTAQVQGTASGLQTRQRIRQGLNELPDAIHEFRATMSDSRVVLQSAEKNFKNLEGFTDALGARGPDVADALLRAVQNVDALVKDMGDVAKALNNRTGSVGRFINDPQFYDNVNVLMFNANKVLGSIDDLTLYIKPVLVNARIFLDKVAVEPGRLISGAVNPSNVK